MEERRKQIGALGEALAAELLQQRGYSIIKKNYSCPWGEIDIIAKRKDVMAFVEVKTRFSTNHGSGRAAVNDRKQRHIRYSAEYFLQRTSIPYREVDFQVIEITAEHLTQLSF